MKGARTGIYLRAEINMVSRALHVFHYYIVHFPALTRASLTIIACANHVSRPLQDLLFSLHFSAPIEHAVCHASHFDGFRVVSVTRQMAFLS